MRKVLFCRGDISESKKGYTYVNKKMFTDFVDEGGNIINLQIQIIPNKNTHPEKNFEAAEKELNVPEHFGQDFLFRIYVPDNSSRGYAELIGMTTEVRGRLSRTVPHPSHIVYLAVSNVTDMEKETERTWFPLPTSEKENFEKEATEELEKTFKVAKKELRANLEVAEKIISGQLSGVGRFYESGGGSERKLSDKVEHWDGFIRFDFLPSSKFISYSIYNITDEENQNKKLSPDRIAQVQEIKEKAEKYLNSLSLEQCKEKLKKLLKGILYLEKINPVILKQGKNYDGAKHLLDTDEKGKLVRA